MDEHQERDQIDSQYALILAGLSAKQRDAVELDAVRRVGPAELGELVGVSSWTIWNWRRRADYQQACDLIARAALQLVARRVAEPMADAMDALVKLVRLDVRDLSPGLAREH